MNVINIYQNCSLCKGMGYLEMSNHKPELCPKCAGKGEVAKGQEPEGTEFHK